ncbi:MAG: cell division protein ZapD [Chromatiales bacterium]|jgi:cell division protein ZapD|nr:cell division protein ZapD [Chromatiales bacterium]
MASIPTADLFNRPAEAHALGLYEQPLSERMRTYLRLEYLYQQFCFYLEQQSEWGSRAVVSSLLDILAILGRGDVRGDVLKDLERQIAIYDRYQNAPGVDEVRLKRVLRNLQDLRQRLFGVGSQYLQLLKDNEFLAQIKHRSAIPGGTCEFDLPDYSHWLRRPYAERVEDIERWMQHLRPLCDSIAELLWLTRESGRATDEVANHGVYQHGPVGDAGVGLLRVSVGPDAGLYPEISGSHHRFTIRFMQWPDTRTRPTQAARDVQFRLTIC